MYLFLSYYGILLCPFVELFEISSSKINVLLSVKDLSIKAQIANTSLNFNATKLDFATLKSFPQILLNDKAYDLLVNFYGQRKGDPLQMYLAYVKYNGGDRMDCVLETGNYFHLIKKRTNKNLVFRFSKKEVLTLYRENVTGHSKVCKIKAIIGPYFYKTVRDVYKFNTVRQILEFIKNHVSNVIGRSTKIYSSLKIPLNMIFQVQRLFVIPDSVCNSSTPKTLFLVPLQKFCDYRSSLNNTLEVMHTYKSDGRYCLVVAFISHPFLYPNVGFAYLGGFCDSGSHGFAVNPNERSMIMNYTVLSVIMTHEVGHLLGCKHDEQCVPAAPKHYIMDSAFSQESILQFTDCSKKSMESYAAKQASTPCFDANNIFTVCGNAVLENEETCDCGINVNCECCGRRDCKLLPNVQCSPYGQNGVCCDSKTCRWLPRSANIMCAQETECEAAKYCSENAGCVTNANSKTKMFCMDNSKRCVNNTCESSICALWNFVECHSSLVSESRCLIHCQQDVSSACTSILNMPYNQDFKSVDRSSVFYAPGSLCKNASNYCNLTGYCINFEFKEYSSFINLIHPMFYEYVLYTLYRYVIFICFEVIFYISIIVILFQLPFMIQRINYFTILLLSIAKTNY